MPGLSQVEIVSQALVLLGDRPIQSLDEDRAGARAAKQVYQRLITKMLIHHPWRWASKTARLVQLSEETPIELWEFVYKLPSDYLLVNAVMDSSGRRIFYYSANPDTTQPFEIYSGGRLASNVEPLILDYVYRAPEANWSASFQEAAIYMLASELAVPVTDNPSITQMFEQKADMRLRDARFDDSRSRPRAMPPIDPISRARRT